MKLSVEELLKLRAIVTIPFPGMEEHGMKVGDILTKIDSDRFAVNQRGELVTLIDWELFKEIFRPLQWWERREPEELSWYIKHGQNGKPRKVETYNLRFGFVIFEGGRKRNLKPDWLPITESEYSSYKQSIKS